MEVIIRSGIIVTGLLFIRKLAMGKISRKLQYYMWGILPIVLLIFPYFLVFCFLGMLFCDMMISVRDIFHVLNS